MREFLHQGYWFLRDEPWLVGLVLLLGVIAVGAGFAEKDRLARLAEHKEWFFHECMEDHKEYECEVLWQQSLPQKKQRAPIYMTMDGKMAIPL